jgi:hypothetical protein
MKDLMSRPSSFCAIDASTNSLAFAYFKNNNLEKYGKVKFFGNDIYEKIMDTAHKTQAFFNQFESLEYIIIEQPIYLNSPKTAANLSMSHGALVGSASLAGVKYMASVSPMQWQNWIGNKRLTGEEKEKIKQQFPDKSSTYYKTKEREFRKQRTIKFVNNKFNIHVSDDDVSDAIAIGAWSLDNWGKVF